MTINENAIFHCLAEPAVLLGRASYSFYSLQAFWHFLMLDYRPALVTAVPALGRPWTFLAFDLATLTALALAAYWFVEEPARRHLSSSAPRTGRDHSAPPLRAPGET